MSDSTHAPPGPTADARTGRPTFAPGSRVLVRAVLVAALAVLLALAGASVAVTAGAPMLGPGAAVEALRGLADDSTANVVVRELRVPRLVLAAVGGAALGLAGALLQGGLRNPLAGPELIGVNAGAALVIGTLVIVGVPTAAPALPVLALLGGLAGGAAVMAAAWRHADRGRVILVGAAVTAVLHATLFAVVASGAQYQLGVLFRFLLGSLANLTWDEVRLPVTWSLMTVPLALAGARRLNLLRLPDDVAEQLGVNVARTRLLLIALAVALIAPVVAVAGAIGWISLLSPHLVRQAAQTSDARLVLPLTALTGAALLIVTDQAARLVFRPLEVPVGSFTTLFGGVVLLVLLRRRLVTVRS